MNGVRVGIIALALSRMFACSVGGWAGPNVSYTNPFMIIGISPGVIALGAAIGGLFDNTTAYLAVMMVAVGLLWLVTVVDRLFSGTSSSQAIPEAGDLVQGGSQTSEAPAGERNAGSRRYGRLGRHRLGNGSAHQGGEARSRLVCSGLATPAA